MEASMHEIRTSHPQERFSLHTVQAAQELFASTQASHAQLGALQNVVDSLRTNWETLLSSQLSDTRDALRVLQDWRVKMHQQDGTLDGVSQYVVETQSKLRQSETNCRALKEEVLAQMKESNAEASDWRPSEGSGKLF